MKTTKEMHLSNPPLSLDQRELALASFLEAQESYIPKIERTLANHLHEQHPSLQPALDYACLNGGKRLRPFLIWAIGQLFSLKEEVLLTVGAAMEMVHTYSLVHDDLPAMDNAELRRGKATCHKIYGEANAILVGDGLLTLAFEILSCPSSHLDQALQAPLIFELARAAGSRGMVAGQWLDLLPDQGTLALHDVQERHHLKSGTLIACSCVLPAILAHQPQDSWRAYGEKIGLAFQIIDDILDVQGITEVTGKQTAIDQDKTTFASILGIDQAWAQAQELVHQAQNQVNKMTINCPSHLNILQGLAEYIIRRSK